MQGKNEVANGLAAPDNPLAARYLGAGADRHG
jgi:hypothetical protein